MEVNYEKVIPEKKCKKCGKSFIAAPQHIYTVTVASSTARGPATSTGRIER
jgi:hypothetical protein